MDPPYWINSTFRVCLTQGTLANDATGRVRMRVDRETQYRELTRARVYAMSNQQVRTSCIPTILMAL